MLEKLDDIDWKQFSCPRGSAEAIPELLRALADTPELSLQAKLERTLHDALATAHAPTISFLYELIDAEQTQNKSGLIRLVVKLSILGELPRATMRLRSWDVAEAKACYQAAADGEAVLLRAASSEREDVRSHAIWALAFFAAGLQDETVAHIADIAQKAGHFSRACAVLALGIIDFQKNTNTHLPLLQALFDSDTGGNGLVKTATAISILVSASFTTSKRKQKLESGEAMLSFLLDKALPFFAGQQQDENYLPFYAGRMDRYITAVLALADPDKILSMLPALAASLSSLSEKAQKHMIEAMFMLIDKAHPKLKTRDFNA
ncbi:MAG: hypothetical protein LBV04_02365, partial [Deferribacteraceae bacterium]|nr:hypothetical protein [Deferribacteraceae bacterium]